MIGAHETHKRRDGTDTQLVGTRNTQKRDGTDTQLVGHTKGDRL